MGHWILRMNNARHQFTDLALSTAPGKQEFEALSPFTDAWQPGRRCHGPARERRTGSASGWLVL
jgi:hypothetical protein